MELGRALTDWSNDKGWRIVASEPVFGEHAAVLTRLGFTTPDGVSIPAVYKRFATSRATEASLYPLIAKELGHFAPQWFGTVMGDGEYGIVLADAGMPVKRYLDEHPSRQQECLVEVARWLASLHISHESTAREWLDRGLLQTYPFDAIQAWWQQALDGLEWAERQDVGGITPQLRRELDRLTQSIGPQLSELMTGRQTLTHGDPHLGNILLNPTGFCLVDWEFACASVPQRDLSVLVQDILDPALFDGTKSAFEQTLAAAGWNTNDSAFQRTFNACLFDNTLMMIGWEIQNVRRGHSLVPPLDARLRIKLDWLLSSGHRIQE